MIKLTAVVVFLAVVGYQLLYEKDTAAMWNAFVASWSWSRSWILVVVLLLMPVNWLIESLKWRLLMRPALALPVGRALRAVFAGVALSLFTPNRIGEYGGRLLFVPAQYNWRAVISSLTGSFAQNLTHLTIGIAAASLLVSTTVGTGQFVVAIAIALLGFVAYFNLGRLGRLLQRVLSGGRLDRVVRQIRYLEKINRSELAKALLFSFLRYSVFCTQFVLLLLYFDASVPLWALYAGVSVMFLVQTSIPLPPFVDVVVRGQVGITLWSIYGVNELAVLTSSFFVWIINLLIPAFFGLAAMTTVNVLRSLGYEKKVALSNNTDPHDGYPIGTAQRPDD